nr:MAG TPA: hypothetical protein [Caudoviricetes sp.]
MFEILSRPRFSFQSLLSTLKFHQSMIEISPSEPSDFWFQCIISPSSLLNHHTQAERLRVNQAVFNFIAPAS